MIIDVKEPPSPYSAYALDPSGANANDNTSNLQYLLNQNLGTYYFPTGRYAINDTIIIPAVTGLHIIGSGMAQMVPDCDPVQGAESVIMWKGAEGGTMIEYRGSGLVWDAMTLWGSGPGSVCSDSSSSAQTTRAGIGIKFDQTSQDLAAGKAWFGSILIENCDSAIETASGNDPENTAFGFFWCQRCTNGIVLNGDKSIMWSLQYVHTVDVDTVFKVANGGQIFTQCMRVETEGGTVLDVAAGDAENAFYQLNGLVIADDVEEITLLKNVYGGDGTQLFRFTNADFGCAPQSSSSSSETWVCKNILVNIDRSGASNRAVSTLEIEASNGVDALAGNVAIEGATNSPLSHLIVRESEVTRVANLIDVGASSDYTYTGLSNWTYGDGIRPDENGRG